jgi:hypothetical protein
MMFWRALASGLGCMLMATAAGSSERVFFPTSIVCPEGQDGILELGSTSNLGQRELLKVSFEDGNAVLVEIEAAEIGDRLSPIFKKVPSAAELGSEAEIARNAATYAGQFLRELCLKDPEARQQQWLLLKEQVP